MNKAQVFFKKHSSTILTFVGSAGVIATAVFAVKATPKAIALLEEAKEEKGSELTKLEVVKTAWKPYIPATITGVSTIACIFGANYLNSRTQASLMSAYALLDSSYQEYRKKTNDVYGEDADLNIKKEIVSSKYVNEPLVEEGKELFFDWQSCRYFESTMEEVKRAEYIFNQNFAMTGFACINDFYDILHLEHVKGGDQLGWSTISNDSVYGYSELSFEFEKIVVDDGSEDGVECWVMTMPCPPTLDYMF